MSAADSNVASLLLGAGRDEAPAILFEDQVVAYAELRDRALGVARALLRDGGRKGDRVGILAENGPFFAAAYLGLLRAGLCAVPLPTAIDGEGLARIARLTDMRTILASARYAEDDAVRETSSRTGLVVRGEALGRAFEATDEVDFPEIDDARDLAAILLTSGSTGEAKGVMVSHRNIACNTRDIVAYMGLQASDRVMVVLPFYYCYGLSLLHTHLAAGASAAIHNAFMFPEKTLDDLAAKECTGLAGVPSTFQILLRKTRFKERRFPSLRWLQQAGGKLSDPFIRELRAAHPEVKLYVMYGQTEATARLSYLPPERLEDKLGSIGRGLPSTKLEVLKADGAPARPGSEEIGEIVAEGDNVTLGYWRDPAETARYFRDGKLYTGDLARVDADGYIFIADRERDFIKSMGNRVGSKEIEDVIAEMPGVLEVAVVGAPHELWGEAIVAVVAPARPGALAERDVIRHCNERLPNYKVPQTVRLVDRLPKNEAGKVLKALLRPNAESAGTPR